MKWSSKAKVFDSALQHHGGRLNSDQIHPDTAPGFEEFITFFNDVLCNSKRKFGAAEVHCDWVANTSFNALATSLRDHELIGIFAGVPLLIYNHSYCFLSDPETLPNVGNGARESPEERVLEGLRKGQLSPLPKGPRDPVRHDAAMHLAWGAVAFVFFHELAHIAWGHLRLLTDYTGSCEYLELPMHPLSDDVTRLRLLLELDADNFAAATLSLYWKKWWDGGSFKALENLGRDTSWAISLSMLFLVMDSTRSVQPALGQATHPPPLVRLINIATLGANEQLPAYTGSEEAMVLGLEEVKAWRQRAGLRPSQGRHGIDWGVHEHLNLLRKELAEKYVAQLNQYSAARVEFCSTLQSSTLNET